MTLTLILGFISLLVALYRVWQTRNYAKLAEEAGNLRAKLAVEQERVRQLTSSLKAYQKAVATPRRSFADIAAGVREQTANNAD